MMYLHVAALIIASSLFNPLAAPEVPKGFTYRYQAVMYNTKVIDIPVSTPIVTVEEPKGRWVWAKVTAYSPHPRSCGVWSAYGRTSTGVKVHSPDPNSKYGLAADPRDIPYGTTIYIKEYDDALQRNRTALPTEIAKVDDTGGAMRQFRPHWKTVNGKRVHIEYHIDARFIQQSTAVRWGVKYLEVFIYE